MGIKENIAKFREELNLHNAKLIAVSKTHPAEKIREAYAAGQRIFGENKVQELTEKAPQLPDDIQWHLIGHLQRNKARKAAALFDLVHSLDSLRLAETLNRAVGETRTPGDQETRRPDSETRSTSSEDLLVSLAPWLPVLIQVNVSGEASKFGFRPEQLLSTLGEINALPKIEIHGLMTIAPWTPEPEKVRPVFRQLRELKEQAEQALGAPLAHLSMGMSGDFEVAIEEGATLVRLGTALFGAR